jgi:glycosyltransferase involved in cell wall biosynthesis
LNLVVQIPCYNEENHIVEAVKSIPEEINGIDNVKILVINDGSTDTTCEKVKNLSNAHILNLPEHVGLAQVFKEGIKKSLEIGADIIVNFDADLQYDAREIEGLVSPIISGKANVVIGERPYWKIKHFSFIKKILLFTGSRMISLVTGYNLKDAATGFRAFSKESVKNIKIYSSFTYTLETLIYFSRTKTKLVSIPLKKINLTRPSRLFRTNFQYIFLSVLTVIQTLWRYVFISDLNK